jgi:pimeloyl-ACP methyl ester carboxylesterase
MRSLDVPVGGGALRVAQWGDDPPRILGLHGITASSVSLAPLARALAPAGLVAPDLRGRGGSASLPGPFGMAAHADDCAAIIGTVGDGPMTVVGESMGAFVGVTLAARHPDLVRALVLVDGGLPLSVPAGLDPDAIVDALLGPAVERLRLTFPSLDAYFDYWREHPALGEVWGPDVEAYLEYDLTGEVPSLRSTVSEEAVRADGADTIVNVDRLREALEAVRCPVHLFRATRNLVNAEPPLFPDEVVDQWRHVLTSDTVVEDTNHYSIIFGDRGVAAVAARALNPEQIGRDSR